MAFSGKDIEKARARKAARETAPEPELQEYSPPSFVPPSSLLRPNLLEGEELLSIAEQHPIVVWSRAGVWIFFAAIALYFRLWQPAFWFGIIACGSYFWGETKRKQLQIGLTAQRLIATRWTRSGRETVALPLSKIESVIVDEIGSGNYGTLRISGTGSVMLRFENIRQPGKFRQAIQEQLSHLS